MDFKHSDREQIIGLLAKLTEARNLMASMRSSIFIDGGAVDKVTLSIADLQMSVIEVLGTGVTPDEKRRAACPKCNGSVPDGRHADDCPKRPLYEEPVSIQRRFIGHRNDALGPPPGPIDRG